MNAQPAQHVRQMVDDVYRAEARHVYAILIRLLGDFDLAEDALHDAFAAHDLALLAASLHRSSNFHNAVLPTTNKKSAALHATADL